MIPMVTPFTEDFRLDLDALRHNLRFTIEHGVTTGNGSLLVGGAAGEHPLLSVDERKAVMEAAVDAVQGDAPVITSIQHTDARTVADMARHAARVGISAVQVSPAYYYPATEGDVLRLFHRVAAAADVSIMAYNTWWLGFSMSLDLIEQLAEIETVRALKWATPDDDSFRDGIVTFADRLVVLDNTDNLAWSHALGARGFVGHLGTCWPEYPLKTWSLLEAHDYVGVKDHMASFKWAWRRWIAKVGEVTAGEGPILKAPMETVGLPAGPPRPPATRPPEHLMTELRELMAAAGVPTAGSRPRPCTDRAT